MKDTDVSLDLETTGLNPKTDKIIEVGAVKVVQGCITDTYATFVNPGRPLDETIIALTGITQEQVEGAKEPTQMIPELLDFIGSNPLLGHSILFDYSFVKRAAVNQSRGFETTGIDTLRIARRYLANLESRNLGCLCRYYGIELREHRALEDATATHLLYQLLCAHYYKEETADNIEFQAIPLRYQVKKEGPITKQQKKRLYELLKEHRITIAWDVEKLTRNEASRYTDQILAKYGR
ncbi:MAG: 3'-5' exonuclease [Lachnospiraceae bacterium]